jgi:hypothetical protein
VFYRADGQGSSDPYRVTSNDKSTMQLIADHAWNMRAASTSCPWGSNSTRSTDGRFLDIVALPLTSSSASPLLGSSDLMSPLEATQLADRQRNASLLAYAQRSSAGGNASSPVISENL